MRLRYNPNHRGSDIADITALMDKSVPWPRSADQQPVPGADTTD